MMPYRPQTDPHTVQDHFELFHSPILQEHRQAVCLHEITRLLILAVLIICAVAGRWLV